MQPYGIGPARQLRRPILAGKMSTEVDKICDAFQRAIVTNCSSGSPSSCAACLIAASGDHESGQSDPITARTPRSFTFVNRRSSS